MAITQTPVIDVTSPPGNGLGVPVTEATNGQGKPVTKVTNGYGTPVVYVASGGLPVVTV